MKNTSIEWLFNLTNEGYWDSLDDASKQKALKLGMDMHKEEIEAAFNQGYRDGEHDDGNTTHILGDISQWDDSENYYNETYGGNK